MSDKMNCKVTLEMIYDELKRVSKRIGVIEEAIGETSIDRHPKVAVTKREEEEIKRSLEELKKEYYVTLKELETA